MPEITNGTAPTQVANPQSTPVPGQSGENQPAASDTSKSLDSERFAALSRKEKAILQLAKKTKQQERALQEKYAPYEKYQKIEQLRLEGKHLEAAELAGFKYTDLTDAYLQREAPTPEQVAMRAAEDLVNRRIAESEKQRQEQATAAQEQQMKVARQRIISQAKDLAGTSADFPFVKSTEEYDTVFEYVKQEYDETGQVLPIEQALKNVNDYFKEETAKLAEHLPLEVIEAIRSKLLPKEPQQTPAVRPDNSQQTRTLTHKTTTAPANSKPMTPEEKRQRAIEVFYGRS